MEDEQKLVKLERPDTPELPEEGFVPYASEAYGDQDKRLKPAVVIMIAVGILALVVMIVLMVGKNHNYYERLIKSIGFDYRNGELIAEDLDIEKGVCANAVSAELSGKSYSFDTVMYSLDESNLIQEIVSEYYYEHTPEKDTIKSIFGAKGVMMKKKTTEEIPLGTVTTVKSSTSLLLKEYLFGTTAHDVYTFDSYDAYQTTVGGRNYTCEVWLMCDSRSGTPVHYTLYRYYSGTRLAAVRVINDIDMMTEIYDVKSYSVG